MKSKLNEMSLSELKKELMILRLKKVHVGMDRKIKNDLRKLVCDKRKAMCNSKKAICDRRKAI